jgi:P27 family predicted phage terminase small subunit
MGTLTLADSRSLALLCEMLAQETQLRLTLQREGLLVNGAGKTQKSHPAVRCLESTRAQAMKMLDAFGLNPKARLGVDMKPLSSTATTNFGNNGAHNRLRRYTNPMPWEE